MDLQRQQMNFMQYAQMPGQSQNGQDTWSEDVSAKPDDHTFYDPATYFDVPRSDEGPLYQPRVRAKPYGSDKRPTRRHVKRLYKHIAKKQAPKFGGRNYGTGTPGAPFQG
jgi:hypothetical protein